LKLAYLKCSPLSFHFNFPFATGILLILIWSQDRMYCPNTFITEIETLLHNPAYLAVTSYKIKCIHSYSS
jgi:hypothetical protein